MSYETLETTCDYCGDLVHVDDYSEELGRCVWCEADRIRGFTPAEAVEFSREELDPAHDDGFRWPTYETGGGCRAEIWEIAEGRRVILTGEDDGADVPPGDGSGMVGYYDDRELMEETVWLVRVPVYGPAELVVWEGELVNPTCEVWEGVSDAERVTHLFGVSGASHGPLTGSQVARLQSLRPDIAEWDFGGATVVSRDSRFQVPTRVHVPVAADFEPEDLDGEVGGRMEGTMVVDLDTRGIIRDYHVGDWERVCAGCGTPLREDEILWRDPETGATAPPPRRAPVLHRVRARPSPPVVLPFSRALRPAHAPY